MKAFPCGVVALWLGCAGGASAAPTVGIAFDAQCTSCSVLPAPGIPFQAYVMLSDWSRGSHCIGCGLAEVDFRIDGIPTDWAASYASSPLASFASDPLATGGAKIQFDPPLTGVTDCFVLYTLTLVPTSTPGARLSVVEHPLHNCLWAGHRGPSWTECPTLGPALLCDGECAPGGIAYTNGAPCQLTALQTTLWNRVKAVYK